MVKVRPGHRAFANSRVAEIFLGYPKEVRSKLLFLRKLIFDTTAATEGVGELEETLRWGEPTYLTTASGTGSLVRMIYPNIFTFEGKRAITFQERDVVPVEELRHCIALALAYHRDKRGIRKKSTSTRLRA